MPECGRGPPLGDRHGVEGLDIVHADHRTPPPRQLDMRRRGTVDQRVPSGESPEPRWGTRVDQGEAESGGEKVMASDIAPLAKITARMWCRMQAPSPPDALDEEGRIQGERSASSPYHHTIGKLGSTPCVCDCGPPGVLLRGDGGDLLPVRAFERMGERHEVLACRG